MKGFIILLYAHREAKMMSKKIALLFTIAVLVASFVLVAIPPASALTRNTFDDSHTTARLGNSKVCGDHICKAGEHEKMTEELNNAQRGAQAGHPTTSPTTPSGSMSQSMSNVCTVVKNALDKEQVDSAVTAIVMSKLGC